MRNLVLDLAGSTALIALLALGTTSVAFSTDPASLAERIDSLREAIARDKAELREQLVTPVSEDGPPPAEDPELRAIAMRLPDMQRELRMLERSRARTENATAAGAAEAIDPADAPQPGAPSTSPAPQEPER